MIRPSKLQIFITYLGQKVVLVEPLETSWRRFPVGSVGVFDAVQARPGMEPAAVVIFDNDRLQSNTEVEIDSLVPLEFFDGVLPEREPEVIA